MAISVGMSSNATAEEWIRNNNLTVGKPIQKYVGYPAFTVLDLYLKRKFQMKMNYRLKKCLFTYKISYTVIL